MRLVSKVLHVGIMATLRNSSLTKTYYKLIRSNYAKMATNIQKCCQMLLVSLA